MSTPKDKSKIVFYQTGLNEADALYLERAYIKLFGRKIDGGVLLNITEGGEGVSGLRHTDATKQKMRKSMSDEARQNMSKAKLGTKRGPQTDYQKQQASKSNSGIRGSEAAKRGWITRRNNIKEKYN